MAVYHSTSSPRDGSFGFKNAYSHIASKIPGFTRKPREGMSPIVAQRRTQLACFSVCRASRELALKHAIVGTRQLLQPNRNQSGGGDSRSYPVRGGFILRNIFEDLQTGRSCIVFMLQSDKANSMPVGRNSHVAAKLADIERCIFGHRLSLTELAEGMDKDWFEELAWAMWWRPELGSRVRRPEANHPFYCPPGDILWIYSIILHYLVTARAKHYPRFPECIEGKANAYYHSGEWHLPLVKTGQCKFCTRPLMQGLGSYFPKLLDTNGRIDIIILRDRKSIEKAEASMVQRSHEYIV